MTNITIGYFLSKCPCSQLAKQKPNRAIASIRANFRINSRCHQLMVQNDRRTESNVTGFHFRTLKLVKINITTETIPIEN